MDFINGIIGALKLPVKLIGAIAFASGLLLILPQGIVNSLGLSELLQGYRSWIGLSFILGAALLLVNLLSWVAQVARNALQKKSLERLAERAKETIAQTIVSGFDENEKAFLREFLIQDKRSIDLPMNNSVVIGLERRGVIVRTGTMGQPTLDGIFIAYELTETASELLTMQALGLHDGDPTDAEIEQIHNRRPKAILNRLRFLRSF